MNAPVREALQHYLEQYARLEPGLPGRQAAWVRAAREEGLRAFAARGFPDRHDEDWKYTSVAALEKSAFVPEATGSATPAAADLEPYALPGPRLVFVDGRLAPSLCRLEGLPAGLAAGGLAESLSAGSAGEFAATLAGRPPTDAFAALNQAFMGDGAWLRVAPGMRVEVPVQLLFVATAERALIQPRNAIMAGEGSSLRVVEQHIALGGGSYWTNAVTLVDLAPGASVEHCKLQQESPQAFHIAELRISQAADSRFYSASFALGAALSRVGIGVGLDGEGAACTLDGLYVADGRRHVDHHTSIDHRRPRGTSREYYKGVLADAGRAVFSGRVVVHPGAQMSDAQQSNRNLLLSDRAEVDTKPQLEIWADDVKCGHGATVGQLDEDQIFYLRSRGMAEAEARAILTAAFAGEMVERLPFHPLREKLDAWLREKLPGTEEAR